MSGLKPGSSETEALKRRLDFLEQNGAEVVVFWPHIRTDGDLKDCFARPFKSPQKSCAIAPQDRAKIVAGFDPLVKSIQMSNPKVRFFDPSDVYCNEANCSFIADGLPMFRDEYAHFSEAGSRLVAQNSWNGPRVIPPLDG